MYCFPKGIRRTKVRGGDGVARQGRCPPSLYVDFTYRARGEESVFSLDGDLNLPKGDLHGLREGLAFEVARGSFDEAVLAIETTTGASCPKRPAEELAAKVSPTLRNALIPVIPIDSPDRVYRCER